MRLDLKNAVRRSMDDIKKAISQKTSEITRLESELRRHESILELLNGERSQPGRTRRGRGRGRTTLRDVLSALPEKFSSREFVKAAGRTKKPPVYLRQTLSRWARQGKIKRVERGRYQKLKGGGAGRAAA